MKPRILLCYLEEYWLMHRGYSTYAGNRPVESSEQKPGSEHWLEFSTLEPIILNRGISRKQTLPPRTHVRRMITPMEGRTI